MQIEHPLFDTHTIHMEAQIPKETILSFIKAYYSSVVQNSPKISNYYSKTASIYRPGMEQNLAKPIDQVSDQIIYPIQRGSRVEIADFSYQYLEDSVNLVVFLNILNSTEKQTITQNFTLSYKDDSVWIESDSITARNLTIQLDQTNSSLLEFKRIIQN